MKILKSEEKITSLKIMDCQLLISYRTNTNVSRAGCVLQEYEIQEMMRPLQEEWNTTRPPIAKMLSLAQALCVVCLAVSNSLHPQLLGSYPL